MFDPSSLSLAALPSVPLSSYRLLPACQGIYFVASNGDVLYIGKAKSLFTRWQSHHRLTDLEQRPGVTISWLQFDGDDALLHEIERACIEYFDPVLNGRVILYKKDAGEESGLRLRVKEIALSQGITDPVVLASRTGIAYATAYRMWQGKIGSKERGVGINVLYKVAQALGVGLFDVLEEA